MTAVQDAIDEAEPHPGEIAHTWSTTAAGWTTVSLSSVVAQITDDDAAGIIATQSENATSVKEGDTIGDSITFSLSSQPTADVSIVATGDDQLEISSEPIVLKADNWNSSIALKVVAVDDKSVEGDHEGAVTFKVTSEDLNYKSAIVATIPVEILDNDEEDDSLLEENEEDEETNQPRVVVPKPATKPPKSNEKAGNNNDGRSDLGSGRTDSGETRTPSGLSSGTASKDDLQDDEIDDIRPSDIAASAEKKKPRAKGPLADLARWLKSNWQLGHRLQRLVCWCRVQACT